ARSGGDAHGTGRTTQRSCRRQRAGRRESAGAPVPAGARRSDQHCGPGTGAVSSRRKRSESELTVTGRRTNMLFGLRGRRSVGVRVTTGVALAATLVGPLRMTYALAGPGAGAPPAGQARMAPGPDTTKLPTDVPWALATAVRPARIKVLAGAADEAE